MILSVSPFGALLAGALFFIIILLLIVLTLNILYLLSLQNALKKVSSQNRTVEPGNVWLMLIPIFSIIYSFILYPKISESLKNEFESRNMPQSGDYGKLVGFLLAIFGVVGVIANLIIPFLATFVGLALLVLWIVYWVQIAGFKSKLD